VRLRARLVLALFATAAATLAVAALTMLPPLQHRLRNDAARALLLHAEAARSGFERLDGSDDPHLSELMRELARATGAQAVLIDDGGPVDDTDPDAPESLGDAKRVLVTRHDEESVQAETAQAAIPLRIAGHPYALSLRRRLGDVDRVFAVVVDGFAGAAGVGLVLALVGGLLLSGPMLRRLRTLRDAVSGERELELDPHRDEIGELSRAYAAMQDRVAGQEAARRTFVATASHELRTPLASLQSLLELVADEVGDEHPDVGAVRADIEAALAQARRLSGLSGGLLDLSRLDADVPLRSEPIELGELTRAVMAEFRARTDGRLVSLPPAEACWALGDPDGVARIVRLLIDNALRHTPPGAVVELRAERRADVVVVRVLDGGPGIPEEERAAVFERFRRGSSSAPGFGLGLAIGRELARRMGGELAVEDGPPGPDEPAGARFALALPAAPADTVEAPAPAEPSSLPNVPHVA
jgi:signal transduction histidine kinase